MQEKRTLAGLILLAAAAFWLSSVSGHTSAAEQATPQPPVAQPAQPAAPPPSAPDVTRRAAEDAAITVKVKAALMADADLKTQAINVETVNATVMLTGIVESAAKSDAARVVVARVEGVRSVDNRLTVKGTTAAIATQRTNA